MRKTAPKHKHVYPPLYLGEHETADRCKPLLLDLPPALLLLLELFRALRERLQRRRVVAIDFPLRTHVGEDGGEVPPLEGGLFDVVAVVRAHKRFGLPALLEEGRLGLGEADGVEGMPPEDIKVFGMPGLVGVD
jgi:hypothetical protein